jgi:hypothetical protein
MNKEGDEIACFSSGGWASSTSSEVLECNVVEAGHGLVLGDGVRQRLHGLHHLLRQRRPRLKHRQRPDVRANGEQNGPRLGQPHQRLPFTPRVQTRAHVPVAVFEAVLHLALQGSVDVLLHIHERPRSK